MIASIISELLMSFGMFYESRRSLIKVVLLFNIACTYYELTVYITCMFTQTPRPSFGFADVVNDSLLVSPADIGVRVP